MHKIYKTIIRGSTRKYPTFHPTITSVSGILSIDTPQRPPIFSCLKIGLDVSTVQHMISFLYTGGYDIDLALGLPKPPSNPTNGDENESSLIIPRRDKDGTFEALLSHLQGDSIADYYDIYSLVGHANLKILLILQSSQAPEIFPRFAQEVSRATGDIALRSIATSALASRLEDIIDSQAFEDMDLGSSLAVDVLRTCGARIREFQAQINPPIDVGRRVPEKRPCYRQY